MVGSILHLAMTFRHLLFSSILFSSVLKADVDFSRLPSDWKSEPLPEAVSENLKNGPITAKEFYVRNGEATLMHLTSKLDLPYTTTGCEKTIRDFKAGFQKKANYPILKSEVVEKDGVHLLHQEIENNKGSRIVTLAQVCPGKLEQIVFAVPVAEYETLLPQVYKLFTSVPPPAEPTSETQASDSLHGDDLQEMGATIAKVCIAIFVGGVLLKMLVSAGKKKPKQRKGSGYR